MMAWPWGSDKSSTERAPPQSSIPSRTSTANQTPPESNPSPDPVPKTSNAPLARDEIADRELQNFLAELEADAQPSSSKYNRVPQPPPPHSKRRDSSAPGITKPANLTLEDDLFPVEMSCREAFDAAFYCQSLGGQFNNVYRYGGIKNCSQHWSSFWFCMRTKSHSSQQRADMIREHYKKRALKYKVGPSSEDIWETREERLPWGVAFSEPVEEIIGTDQEWNERERVRREQRVNDINGTMPPKAT